MRPIVLKMTAFGPYKDTEIVDFRKLEENRLFVISGATGAGKTTIFDGISYALYGQASGEDRASIRALRSHFAEDQVQTAVELVFEIKQRTYRIYREVPYTKKGNKTETPASCHFFEIRDEEEIPVVDRQMVTEINKKVEELIGFTQAQFSQIVMLPQGEFRKFLTSDTENKELIMRKIFKTDQYRLFVTKLKEQRDEVHAKLQGEEQQKHAMIDHIKTVIPARNNTLSDVLQQESILIEQVVDALTEEQSHYNAEVESAKQQYDERFKQHAQLVNSYHEAKIVHEQFDTLMQKNEIYQGLYAQIPHFQKQSEQIKLGEQASFVDPFEERLVEVQKEVAEAKNIYFQSVETVKQEKEQYVKVQQDYQLAEEQQPEYEKMKTERYHLQQLKPKIEQLQDAQIQQERLQQASVTLKGQLESVTERFTSHQQLMDQIEGQIAEGEKPIQFVDEKRDRLNRLMTICEKIQQYMEQNQLLEATRHEKDAASIRLQEAKRIYGEAKQQWLVSEAVALAAELQEGDACPVCGSQDHPNKAHATEQHVSEEELQNFEQGVNQSSERYQLAVARVESIEQQVTMLETSLETFTIATNDIQTVQKEMEDEREGLQVELMQLMKQRQVVEQLRQQLREGQQQENRLRTEKDQLTHERLQQEERLKYVYSTVQQLTEEVPDNVKDINQYMATLQSIENHIAAFEQKWQRLQIDFDRQKERYLTAENHEAFNKSAVETLEKKIEEVEQRFEQAIEEAEFDSVTSYQNAKLDRQILHAMKKEIDSFKEQYNRVREEMNDLKEHLAGKERIDLQQLDNELQKLKQAYETALQNVNQQQHLQNIIEQAIIQLQKIMERTGQLEKTFGKVEELYNLIRGQNHSKLSFERYIQIEYLEQMLQAANERLHELSNGQYELLRSDRQEERGRQSGLGLDVYDAYTGQTRDVKTLSGGEKFNAALCLALGMSDIIQSFQGAVSIDTMFIDEGFGTLDEESLAKAIDTLIELQKSGRMIGVISHVEELKAAFPAILEVSKTKEGYSTTTFHIK